MADKQKTVDDSSSSKLDEEEEALMAIYGSESGWVEARTHCDHLDKLSSVLTHIPTPDTPWGCLALGYVSGDLVIIVVKL
nr:histone deacetylase 6 [Tanacetum cinerariifolium]